MPRLARQYSETGLYHIFFRGQNRQHIFEEDEDYKKMLEILSALRTKGDAHKLSTFWLT